VFIVVNNPYLEVPSLTVSATKHVYAPTNTPGYALLRINVGTEEGTQISGTAKVMCIDLTQMFGSTIADYVYSLEQSTAGAGVAWFRKLFPKDYYEYNAGTLKSVEGLSAHETVGFNQWNSDNLELDVDSGIIKNTDGSLTISNVPYQENRNRFPVVQTNSQFYIEFDATLVSSDYPTTAFFKFYFYYTDGTR